MHLFIFFVSVGITLFHIHTVEVTGSNPVSSTNDIKGLQFALYPFFI